MERHAKIGAAFWRCLMTTLRWIGNHPAFCLSLPSAYLLLSYPPLWKDIDALAQIIEPASVTNIYHFPALYCFLCRVPIWLGDLLHRPHWPELLYRQYPTLAGLYFLIALQQAALVMSLVLLVRVAGRNPSGRGLIVLLLASGSGLYAQAQTCGSEAWGLVALILVYAFGLRLFYPKTPNRLTWIWYTGALLFAVGSRHIDMLLGCWLIALFILSGLVQLAMSAPTHGRDRELPERDESARFNRRAEARRCFTGAVLALICWGAALGLNAAISFGLARIVHIEPRTTLGRTLSDRLKVFLAACSPAERNRIALRVAGSVTDPDVKAAVIDQNVIGSFYDGTGRAIAVRLAAEGYQGEALGAKTDRIILASSLAYYRTLHPKLIEVIWRDFRQGLVRGNNAGLAAAPFEHNRYVAETRSAEPSLWKPLSILPTTFAPAAIVLQHRASKDVYLGFGNRLRFGLLFGAAAAAAIVLTFWRGAGLRVGLPVLTILATGLVVFGATMICVYYMDRYTIPLEVSALAALSLILGESFERPSRGGGSTVRSTEEFVSQGG